jgi:hypothetical protein
MNKKISSMILCAWMLNTSAVNAAENNFRCEPIGNFTREFLGKFKIGSYTIDPTQSGAFIAMKPIEASYANLSKEENIQWGMGNYLTQCGMLNNSDFQSQSNMNDSLDDCLAKLAKLTNKKIVLIEVGGGKFLKPDFFSSTRLAVPTSKKVLKCGSNLLSDQSVQIFLQAKNLIEIFKSWEGIFFLYHEGMEKLFKCEGISREQYSENRDAWNRFLWSNDAEGKNWARESDKIRTLTSAGKNLIKDVATTTIINKIFPSGPSSTEKSILSTAVSSVLSAAKGFTKNQLPNKFSQIIGEKNKKRIEEKLDGFLLKKSPGKKLQKLEKEFKNLNKGENYQNPEKNKSLREEHDRLLFIRDQDQLWDRTLKEINALYAFNSKLMEKLKEDCLKLEKLIQSRDLKGLINCVEKIKKIRDKEIQNRLTEIEKLKEKKEYQSIFEKYDKLRENQERLMSLEELKDFKYLDGLDNYILDVKVLGDTLSFLQYFKESNPQEIQQYDSLRQRQGFLSLEILLEKNDDLKELINYANGLKNFLSQEIKRRMNEIDKLRQSNGYQSAFEKYDECRTKVGAPSLESLINSCKLSAIDDYINDIKIVKNMQAFFRYFIDHEKLENLNEWLKEIGFSSFEELENKNDLTTLINACNAIENSLRSKNGWSNKDFEIVYNYK